MTTSTPAEAAEAPAPPAAGFGDRDGEGQASATRWRSLLFLSVCRLAFFAALMGAWQLIAKGLDIEFFISTPGAVFSQIVEWAKSGYIFEHLLVTVQEMLWGYVIGAAVAIVAAFALGLIPLVGRILEPFINALYSTPKLALAPLFVLWFGIGFQMKLILTAVTVFFLVFYSTYRGVAERNEELMDVLRVMGASWLTIVRKVVVRNALSHMYVGLKLAVPYALIGAVVGELIASNKGIGFVLMVSASQFDTPGLLAGIVYLILVGVIISTLLNKTEAYFMRYRTVTR